MVEPLSRRRLLTLLAALAPGLRADEAGGSFQAKGLWRTTPLDVFGEIGYFIDEPCLGARPGDVELAEWALQAWQRTVDGLLCFTPAPAASALVRVYWGQTGDRIGKMQAIEVGDRRGAEVYVDTHADRFDAPMAGHSDADPLFRDAVLYRTLLHEIGHGLGLVHTTGIEDAMYFGGDYVGFYLRYRNSVGSREEMRFQPGISATDRDRMAKLYPADTLVPPRAPKIPEA
ncbi:MAG: hypothetical protein GC160_29040 [Acidobacteria bacterium]|nr:hypothetical protein [Acidobacteriota bacterium]